MRRGGMSLALAPLLLILANACEQHHTWFKNPLHDQLNSSNCTNAACEAHERPLFNSNAPAEYYCACEPGFHRAAAGQPCTTCPAGNICPDHSDRAFSCPPNTQPAKHVPTGTNIAHVYPFTYCVPRPGQTCTLVSNMLREFPHRIFLRDTAWPYLYTARCQSACGKNEDTGNRCACLPGYFRDDRQACTACPPGFYCSQEQRTPCPPGNTSHILSGSPGDCHVISCPDGKYFDTTARACVTCPVRHYCRRNTRTPCPPHATTSSIGSPSPAHCVCQRPYYVQPLPHTQHGFACAVRATHAPALDPVFPAAVFHGKANFDSRLVWHAPRSGTPGLVGCIARLDMHAMSLEVAVVLADNAPMRVFSYAQEALQSEFLHQCRLDHLHARASGDAALHAHIYLRCLQRGSREDLRVLKVLAFSFDGLDSAQLAVEPQQYFASARPDAVAFIEPLDIFVELQTTQAVRLPGGAAMYASVSGQVQAELLARGFDLRDVSEFVGDSLVAASPARREANDSYTVTCHALGGARESAAQTVPAVFMLTVAAVDEGGQFCLMVPTQPLQDMVRISAATTSIDVTRGRDTWVRWGDDRGTAFALAPQAGVNTTAYTQDAKVAACVEDFARRFNGTLQKLEALNRSNYSSYVAEYVLPEAERANVSADNYTAFLQSLEQLRADAEAAFQAGNATQPLVDSIFPEVPALQLNESIFFDRQDLYARARPTVLAAFRSALDTCLLATDVSTRFGETFVRVDQGVDNVTVVASNVQVVLHDPKPDPAVERHCFAAETCARIGAPGAGRRLLQYAYDDPTPPPPPPTATANDPPPSPPAAAADLTEGTATADNTVPSTTANNPVPTAAAMANPDLVPTAETWLPGLGREHVIVSDEEETSRVARVAVRACPDHARAHDDGIRCGCDAGFKSDGAGRCAACARYEHCPGGDAAARLCSEGGRGAPCKCADGDFFDSATDACRPCPPDHSCVRGAKHPCSHLERSRHNQCVCRGGYFRPALGAGCRPCPRGSFCQDGARYECPRNATTLDTHAVSAASCVCAAGHRRAPGGRCEACDHGTYRPADADEAACPACPAGETTLRPGSICVCDGGRQRNGSACAPCTAADAACHAGVRVPCGEHEQPTDDRTRCRCLRGHFRRNGTCVLCPAGYHCDAATEDIQSCPPMMTSLAGAQAVEHCVCAHADHVKYGAGASAYCACAPSHFQGATHCTPCPRFSARIPSAVRSIPTERDCLCRPGFWRDGSECQECPPGYFCPGTLAEQGRVACVLGAFQPFRQRTHRGECVPCATNETSAHSQAHAAHESPLQCYQQYLPVQLRGESLLAQAAPAAVDLSFFDARPYAVFASSGECEADLQRFLLERPPVAADLVRCVDNGRKIRVDFSEGVQADTARELPLSQDAHFARVLQVLATHNDLALVLPVVFFCGEVLRGRGGQCHHGPGDPQDAVALLQLDAANITFEPQRDIDRLHTMLSHAYLTNTAIQTKKFGEADFGPRHLRPVRAGGPGERVFFFPVSPTGQAVLAEIDQLPALVELTLSLGNFDEGVLQTEEAPLCGPPDAGLLGFLPSAAESRACAWFDAPLPRRLCAQCRAGAEFWNTSARACQACTRCPGEAAQTPCCADRDTVCQGEPAAVALPPAANASLCGNGVVDYDAQEECDWAKTQGAHCCSRECTLLPGFVDASCATFCGDGIVAGDEVCDESSPLCRNCACVASLNVYFDRGAQQCRLRAT